MLVTPPCGASSNIALWRAKIKPPVELVVGDLTAMKEERLKKEKQDMEERQEETIEQDIEV